VTLSHPHGGIAAITFRQACSYLPSQRTADLANSAFGMRKQETLALASMAR